MPHEFQIAIKQYLALDVMELANDGSWGLVLEWLLLRVLRQKSQK
jgi:hypothetical protein